MELTSIDINFHKPAPSPTRKTKHNNQKKKLQLKKLFNLVNISGKFQTKEKYVEYLLGLDQYL